MSDKNYEPFGEEWVAEMMKFDKEGLVLRIRRLSKENAKLKEERNGDI